MADDDTSGERGSATVLGLGAILLTLSLLLALLVLGAAVHGSLQARAAADAAALAGAGVLLEGGDEAAACAAAKKLSTANGGQLLHCEHRTDAARGTTGTATTARLRVEVGITVSGLRSLQARAVAHAGAVPHGEPVDARGDQ
ncbi:Rv3654c family TadE-like protein [Ornithinimicrobium murale]|uniref:Rv3654c family TadE-like protein n=1 Tax=Ornithinimicrobium murale TaxID=1050153 RepID=UPI0013B3652E|nr:Rv3654c family TadE-like protein [Ornithinimicrobium murale]